MYVAKRDPAELTCGSCGIAIPWAEAHLSAEVKRYLERRRG